MPEVNNKINIELEVLTPLAIGAGVEKDWVLGMDYVVDNNYLYKLNLRKIDAAGIDLQRLTSYFAEKNAVGVKDLIGQRLEEVSDFKMSMPYRSNNDIKADIKAFVKNQLTGKPIVPGSSIKGAIRSILLEYFTSDEQTRNEMRKSNKMDECYILGKPEDGSTFMRFVKFSDVDFEETALVNTKIFNLQKIDGSWVGGWKHRRDYTDGKFDQKGFNTIYEVIGPNQLGNGYLMLSEDGFNRLFDSMASDLPYTPKKKRVLSSVDNLFEIINLHTQSYLKKELAFFKTYQQADKTSEIKENIQYLLSEVQDALNDNSCCIFKMSAGSGFHSITGDWQFDDFTSGLLDRKRHGDAKPKSRKIAICQDEYMLMGFVKMSVMDAETVAEIERQRQERKCLQEEKRQAEEAEQKKQADKADEKRREAEAKARKRSEYETALSDAESYFGTSNKSDLLMMKTALSNFERAAGILPDGGKHSDKIDSIKKIIAGLESALAEQTSIDSATQEAIAAGLAILEDKNLNGQYKVLAFKDVSVRVQRWLKKSGNLSLPESQDGYLVTTLTRLFGSVVKVKEKAEWTDFSSKMWKAVVDWCGEERAGKLYSEVCRKQES
jgi:hypothetical protein